MVNITGKRSLRFIGLAIAVTLVVGGASFGIKEVTAQAPSHKVVAYYFHTNTRCDTCRKIEAYSKEAIQEGFKTELRNGTLEMRIVNYEDAENRHYIKDYKLVSKSLILVNVVDGKQTEWTNLKLVWQLVKNKEAFLNYVRGEVKNYLAKG
ncbi:MAG: nitrophenyl compound nitroreductase subunit ArsF family protein [Acidobacteriota bacterium]